jgi:transcriptional regulator with XRE-family HTH domain
MPQYTTRRSDNLSLFCSSDFVIPICMQTETLATGPDPRTMTPGQRLRMVRERIGIKSGKRAAELMGITVSMYLHHEADRRGITRDRAVQYAQRFRTTPEFILYGAEARQAFGLMPTDAELEAMLEAVQREIPVSVSYADWPRYAASALRTRLEHYQAGHEATPRASRKQ